MYKEKILNRAKVYVNENTSASKFDFFTHRNITFFYFHSYMPTIYSEIIVIVKNRC